MSALYLNNTLQSPLIAFLNSVKLKYHSSVTFINAAIDEHFNQADEIKTLHKTLKEYNKQKLQLLALQQAIKKITKENNATLLHLDPKVSLVRAISYQKFGDFNRIWLDIPEYNSSKIYGLVYQDSVAGIVIEKQSKPLALLNGDIKSTYAVSIGTQNAPGIAHGNNDDKVIVSFIPTWYSVKKGDEVITSGLDNIFFPALKVGRVLSVTKSQGYQRAVVEPYYKANQTTYFHIIRSPY
jgi:rod shape-determining protein MreC